MEKAELQRKGYPEKPGECWGSTFQSGGHRSSERLSNLSQVTQLDKRRSRVETQVFLPERLFCSLPAFFSLPRGVCFRNATSEVSRNVEWFLSLI